MRIADEVGLGKSIEAGIVLSREKGRAEMKNPDHRSLKPSKAVATGTAGEVFPAFPHS
ncbi:MAG: hypothetical protein GXP58_10115 [Deltaproteobacteria bacterium]|nr:hypothetical protein [Deltaproteobacteria bacterium]